MATSVGDRVDYSDLNNWYTTFNNLARNYTNGVSTIAKPSSDAPVLASDVNNLHGLIKKFKTDYYLGSQSAMWPAYTNVTVGNPVQAINLNAIIGTYSNASRVKCKNNATNNKGRHDSTCPRGTNSSTCNNGTNNDGTMYNGSSTPTTNRRGTCRRGMYNAGTCQSGRNSCGTKGSGRAANILNSQSNNSN